MLSPMAIVDADQLIPSIRRLQEPWWSWPAPGTPERTIHILSPIHRSSRWEVVDNGKRKYSFESGIMVFKPKTDSEQGAPIDVAVSEGGEPGSKGAICAQMW